MYRVARKTVLLILYRMFWVGLAIKHSGLSVSSVGRKGWSLSLSIQSEELITWLFAPTFSESICGSWTMEPGPRAPASMHPQNGPVERNFTVFNTKMKRTIQTEKSQVKAYCFIIPGNFAEILEIILLFLTCFMNLEK